MSWRRSAFIFTLTVCSITGLVAQKVNTNVTLEIRDLPLPQILDSISAKSNFYFSYNSDIVPKGSLFSVSASEEKLTKLLDRIFLGTDIQYSFDNDQIILKRTPPDQQSLRKKSEFTISGWVREKESGEYIPGVNVFLNSTSLSSVTNRNGYYKIDNVPWGTYELVFSHLTFEKTFFEVNVQGDGGVIVSPELEVSTNELAAVTITDDRIRKEENKEEWEGYYVNFVADFFGTSFNAEKCMILNPEVLEFYIEDSTQIKAVSTKPLRIRNEALGYMIIYDLVEFTSGQDELSFFGFARFENLPFMKRKEKKTWKKNRKRSYYGSIRHFMKTLVNNSTYREGFRFKSVKGINQVYEHGSNGSIEDVISNSGKFLEWKVEFEDYLFVEYIREKESNLYLQQMAKSIGGDQPFVSNYAFFATRRPDTQKSLIILKEPFVTVDANGHVKQPLGINTVGYWSWERVAELLPIDYDPQKDDF